MIPQAVMTLPETGEYLLKRDEVRIEIDRDHLGMIANRLIGRGSGPATAVPGPGP
jgi:hypothetical protein